MLVQNLLKSLTKKLSLEDSLKFLYNEFSIASKIYQADCIILNYSQLDISNKFLPIVKECRGLILSYDLLSVYCKSFTRFYNYEEDIEGQRNFSFKNSTAFEKIDGTLINLWYHPIKQKWIFSTRRMAYAEGSINGYPSLSFYDIILKVFNANNETIQGYLNSLFSRESDKEYTWIFELVSPETKIITDYKNDYKLYYLTCYNNKTCKEHYSESNYDYFASCFIDNITVPKRYNFSNDESVRKYILSNFKDDEEGFVVFDKDSYNRVKIKNTKYLELAKIKGNGAFYPKRILSYIVNENTDILQRFSDYYELINVYKKKLNYFISTIEKEYEQYKNIENQKDFAIAVNSNPYKSCFFQIRNGKSINEIIKSIHINKLLKYLDEIRID